MVFEQSGGQQRGRLLAEFAAQIAKADFLVLAWLPYCRQRRMAVGGVKPRTGLKVGGRRRKCLVHIRPHHPLALAQAGVGACFQACEILPLAAAEPEQDQHPQGIFMRRVQRQQRLEIGYGSFPVPIMLP